MANRKRGQNMTNGFNGYDLGPDAPTIELSSGEILRYEPFAYSGIIDYGYGEGEVEVFLELDKGSSLNADRANEFFDEFYPERGRWLAETYDYFVGLLQPDRDVSLRDEAKLDSIVFGADDICQLSFTTGNVFHGHDVIVKIQRGIGFTGCFVESIRHIT